MNFVKMLFSHIFREKFEIILFYFYVNFMNPGTLSNAPFLKTSSVRTFLYFL
jgi:hypothetical protein